jgi:hypothetical protein
MMRKFLKRDGIFVSARHLMWSPIVLNMSASAIWDVIKHRLNLFKH